MRRILRTITLVVACSLPWSEFRALAATCWPPPVTGVVVDPFRAPLCPYCAGNRGLEYRVGSNSSVRAVAAGTVSWSGVIGGIRYVVVRHRTGWRATYGRLSATHLRAGDLVLTGTEVGRASGDFYFGLRVGNSYVDPEPFLGRWERRPRLLPVDGAGARPAPPAAVRCGSAR